MHSKFVIGLALSPLGTASAAAPAPPPVIMPVAGVANDAHADPARRAAALRLASLLYSEDSQMRMADQIADNELAPAFRSNDDLKKLDSQYPGFIEEVIRQMKPAFLRFTKGQLPSYQERIALLIAQRLNAEDIEDLTKFYRTPTGQKLLNGMQQNATAGTTIKESLTDPDKPTSYAAVVADHKAAQDATRKLVDESDKAALVEFAGKPYFTSVAALGPAIRKLEQDFANEPAPEFQAEIEAIMIATLTKFEVAKK
ncbi:MAG TPA: DUF2059 domain-containing protein [Sphingomicrobium sp.]|nr:DUF2059 domain-containing protein [Sphingomicrobium sp.]